MVASSTWSPVIPGGDSLPVLPANLSTVVIEPLSVSVDTAGEVADQKSVAEVYVDVVSDSRTTPIPTDPLDVPSSQINSGLRQPHVGEGHSQSTRIEPQLAGVADGAAVGVGGNKTISPRFSSFLPRFREGFGEQISGAVVGRG